MKKITVAFVLPMMLLGCAMETEEGFEGEDEALGEAELALEELNAMEPNALAPNALHSNALHSNALHSNALHSNALSTSALNSIKDAGAAGALSRQLLKYIVGCALNSSQTFTFSWTDSQSVVHNEVYQGSVGLAPEWATGPLEEAEQRWVSACVAARTNYYAQSVIISMRGIHSALGTTPAETTAYAVQEGAFWGNLFDAVPWVRSCAIQTNIGHARTKMRDCAAGHFDGSNTSDCGVMARTAWCSSVCTDRTVPANVNDDGFASCSGTSEVVTTYLPL